MTSGDLYGLLATSQDSLEFGAEVRRVRHALSHGVLRTELRARRAATRTIIEIYEHRLQAASKGGREVGCLPALVRQLRTLDAAEVDLIAVGTDVLDAVVFLSTDGEFVGCFA